MKVYVIIYDIHYESQDVVAVRSTMQLAEEWIQNRIVGSSGWYKEQQGVYKRQDVTYRVEEWEVDG